VVESVFGSASPGKLLGLDACQVPQQAEGTATGFLHNSSLDDEIVSEESLRLVERRKHKRLSPAGLMRPWEIPCGEETKERTRRGATIMM